MGSIINWVRASSSGWLRSPFGDLPTLRADDTPAHQTWLILAGGLGLILSRASKTELESRFVATHHVYRIARARLHKRRLPKPDPVLLRDALQEIANLADPMTREAGRECLARAVERQAAKGQPTAVASSLVSTVSTSQATASQAVPSTQQATVVVADEHQPTQIDLDLLFERSAKLRGAVAWARSTTFGQDA